MISFEGEWTYRSFLNISDQSVEPNKLLFGMGNLVLLQPNQGEIQGTLGGNGWSLNLLGTVTDGEPTIVRWSGHGVIEGENWVYDYLGYLVPNWPNGIDQDDAIVGTIIRAEPHSNGQNKAGLVASWIAVRK